MPALIFTERITADAPAENRRQAERQAVRRITDRVFGTDAEYCHDAYGVPFIEGCTARISVSHCAVMAAMAVSEDSAVGIDIELPRPQLRRIATKILTPGEPPADVLTDAELLKIWTAKEATFKCAGTPSLTISRITVDLQQLTATLPDGRRFALDFRSADYGALIALSFPVK